MVEITKRTKTIIGAGITAIIVYTILFTGKGGEGMIEWQFPEYATCDLSHCYIEGNITHSYTGNITFGIDDLIAKADLIRASSATKQVIIIKEIELISSIEQTYKCEYNIVEIIIEDEKDLNASKEDNETKENTTQTYSICVDKTGAKEKVVFNKTNAVYDTGKAEFTYYENQIIKKNITSTNFGKVPEIVMGKSSERFRVDFDVPYNSNGKFDIELCFTADGERVCEVLDPQWATGNTTYRRELLNLSTTVPLPVNGTGTIAGAVLWDNSTGGIPEVVGSNIERTFSSNGIFTPSSNGTVLVECWGGGGGGGVITGSGGGGGGGGAYAASNVTVAIGTTTDLNKLVGSGIVGDTNHLANYAQFFKDIAIFSGTAKGIRVYTAVNGNAKVAIYSDNAGTPDSLLASGTGAVTATGWNIVDTGDITITAGTTYWLAFNIDTTGAVIGNDHDTGTRKYISATYGTYTFPATFNGTGFTSDTGTMASMTAYGTVSGYALEIGLGGAADVRQGGGYSLFNDTVVAAGGLGTIDATGALGGTVAGSTGTVEFKGGDGKNGDATGDSGGGGGGAGGADGAGVDGNAATTSLGGNGGAGDAGLGGAGGNNVSVENGYPGKSNPKGGGGGGGGDNGFKGGVGGFPGGGGGGAEIQVNAAYGNGANGMCKLTYAIADFYTTTASTEALQIYALNCSADQMYLYYNDTQHIAGAYNTTPTACAWFSTAPTYKDSVAITNLVGYWAFDEPLTNNILMDSSSYGLDGSGWDAKLGNTTAKIYKSSYFDGTNDYILISDPVDGHLDFGAGQAFSINIWVKVSNTDTDAYILNKYEDVGVSQVNGYLLYQSSTGSGVYTFHTLSADTGTITQTGAAPSGNWDMVTAVHLANGTSYIYLNGVLNATSATADAGSKVANVNIKLGTGHDGDYDFTGYLDDLQIYNKALSQAEITALYNLGTSVGDETINYLNITINSEQNVTITQDTRNATFNVTTNDYATCNLSLNGTVYANTTNSTNHTWSFTNITGGNYTIFYNCTNGTYIANSSTYWLYFDIFNITITANDYGVTEPEFYPETWTSLNVTPLSQVDRNDSNQVNSTKVVSATSSNVANPANMSIDGNYSSVWKSGYDDSATNIVHYNSTVATTSCSGNYHATTYSCSKLYDADWATASAPLSSGDTINTILNFTIPANTKNATIDLKDYIYTYTNLTIPATCLNGNVLSIKVTQINSYTNSQDATQWSCLISGSTYYLLSNNQGVDNDEWYAYDLNVTFTVYNTTRDIDWIVDLGSNISNIDYMKFYTVGDENACLFFNVSYSQDNITYTSPQWGWGQRCDNVTPITLDPKKLFDARYIKLTYMPQYYANTTPLLDYVGNLAEFEVYLGGSGIYTWTSTVVKDIQMKVNATNANVTFKASDDWITGNAINLTTSYQTIKQAGTSGMIWLWADFLGEVPSNYTWSFLFQAIDT